MLTHFKFLSTNSWELSYNKTNAVLKRTDNLIWLPNNYNSYVQQSVL